MRANRVPLLFALLLLAILPMRDLWAPDEPDFAQCVREMRERGSWLLPYLNGQPYSEKPILFYWLMKLSAMACERLTGGAGFTHGVCAWALRLPSAAAAGGFLFAFRGWTARFLDRDLGDLAAAILATVPIWLLQAQMIQTDMVFAVLLAWSWLSWLGAGWSCAGTLPDAIPARAWFLGAYAALALAFLAKGPLALALSLPLVLAFLACGSGTCAPWAGCGPEPGCSSAAVIVLPWYLAACLQGGTAYAYQMVVHQNLERAFKAWDHQQPPWRYVEYLAGDFAPWTLLLPALALFLVRGRAWRAPAQRFLILAAAVPFLLLSLLPEQAGQVHPDDLPVPGPAPGGPCSSAGRGGGLPDPPPGRPAGGGPGPAGPGPGGGGASWGPGGATCRSRCNRSSGPCASCALLFLLGAAGVALRARHGDGPALARASPPWPWAWCSW